MEMELIEFRISILKKKQGNFLRHQQRGGRQPEPTKAVGCSEAPLPHDWTVTFCCLDGDTSTA